MTDRLANAQERVIKMIDTVFVKCYQEGFDDGYKEGLHCGEVDGVMNIQVDEVSYQRGLNDVWECARKIACDPDYGGYSSEALMKMFNSTSLYYIFEHFSAQECIAKIKKYEETQKIKVGDIVTVLGDIVIIGDKPNEFIVTWVGEDKVTLISRNGFHARTSRIDCLIKTGEHCDIEKCFKYTVF